MKTGKWTALAVLTLVMGGVLFAEDAATPISADDQVAILRCQKQQSDIQAQYNELYADFLQSPQVSALTAQKLQVNANLSSAIVKALDHAKIDKTKFTLDPTTLKPVPREGPREESK
jgi:hypothetical protein